MLVSSRFVTNTMLTETLYSTIN